VRSIQSITFGTSLAAGTVHAVAYRVLAVVPVVTANIVQSVDALSSGFPRLYDNTTPFLIWIPTATTASTPMGQVLYPQG